MRSIENIEIFKSIPLFKDLTNAELTKLSRICQKVGFKEGDVIFQHGDVGDALYVIREGQADVVIPTFDHETQQIIKGDEQIVAQLGPGQIFGEMALFDKSPRSATIRVAESARLFRISRENFERLMDEDRVMALKLYKRITVILTQRLRETTDRLAIANHTIKASSKKYEEY